MLPLNAWRLTAILRLKKQVEVNTGDDQIFRALVPFAKRVAARRADAVMRKGDISDALYLVLEGSLWVEEVEVELGPGSVVGEMGVLSRTHRRTATVDARSDSVLGRVPAAHFRRVYYADPAIGLALVRLIIERLTREVETARLEAVEA
ncbi:MAG TPA: cyclic nucleotide-binding domain-containing protein [Stellaceae bacterium]|nr:cyclic nucleotide-binding domain-containing protein [Stellaceae bacterium]